MHTPLAVKHFRNYHLQVGDVIIVLPSLEHIMDILTVGMEIDS